MKLNLKVICLSLGIGCAGSSSGVAAPIGMVFDFVAGFATGVSYTGGPSVPSGPLTLNLLLDTSTSDADPAPTRGRFAVTSASLTAPSLGLTNEPITTSLFVDTTAGGFIIIDALNALTNGMGWNGGVNGGLGVVPNLMSDLNDLTTLILPNAVTMNDTFFHQQSFLLANGHTLTGSAGFNHPSGQFSVSAVPLPAALPLFAFGLGSLGFLGWRKRRAAVA